MKRVLVGFFTFLFLFMGSCGKTKKFPELEDGMKVVAETYFNYEAWCHPDEIAQEDISYPYTAYQTTEEQKFPETYLKIETENGEAWYCCTYTRWKAYYINPVQNTLPENLEQVASGEISLPEVTKPVFAETEWKTENIEFTKKNLGYFCARAFDEEYQAGESFEIYLSDFCPENGIMPMMYIICGDEICELRSGMGHNNDWMRADMELTFGTVNEEGWFDTVPGNEISEEKWNHIREIAVLHMECQKGKEPKELSDCLENDNKQEEQGSISGTSPQLSELDVDGFVWAKDQMELYPGIEVEGVFDASREIIKISVGQNDSNMKLSVDGEEKLSVPGNCEFFLQDILKEDACLELLVGEPMMLAMDKEEEKYFRVTAYRLHPDELVEVPLLPSGEGNSFYVSEWNWANRYINNWYYGDVFYGFLYDKEQEKWLEMGYQMMPEGYLMDRRDSLVLIYVDGNPLEIPEENVKIDAGTGVGIAFMWDWGMAGTSHYNIYRSEDSGKTWSLVMEDFTTAHARIDQIYILNENTIFCRFHPSGYVSSGNSAFVTVDGGRKWEYIEYAGEMEKYDFLAGYGGELFE